MSDALTQIRAILTSTPLRWVQLAESTPDTLLRLRPAPAEWSALECLQHLVDTERWVFPVRVEALRQELDVPNFDEHAQGSVGSEVQSIVVLAQTFAQLRATNLQMLAQVSMTEFERKSKHSELGVVTLGELLHNWAAHDLNHTIQAERAIAQPFIRESGPWQPYFVANRVDPAQL